MAEAYGTPVTRPSANRLLATVPDRRSDYPAVAANSFTSLHQRAARRRGVLARRLLRAFLCTLKAFGREWWRPDVVASVRSCSTSRIGGSPKWRLYSRLK
jgi:hypothetical protein